MAYNHPTQAQALSSKMAELGNLLRAVLIITDNPQAHLFHLGIFREDRTCLVAITNSTIKTITDSDDMGPSINKEAMQSSERNFWQESIREDLKPLFLNNTIKLLAKNFQKSDQYYQQLKHYHVSGFLNKSLI
jgi:hypothetical protein